MSQNHETPFGSMYLLLKCFPCHVLVKSMMHLRYICSHLIKHLSFPDYSACSTYLSCRCLRTFCPFDWCRKLWNWLMCSPAIKILVLETVLIKTFHVVVAESILQRSINERCLFALFFFTSLQWHSLKKTLEYTIFQTHNKQRKEMAPWGIWHLLWGMTWR